MLLEDLVLGFFLLLERVLVKIEILLDVRDFSLENSLGLDLFLLLFKDFDILVLDLFFKLHDLVDLLLLVSNLLMQLSLEKRHFCGLLGSA